MERASLDRLVRRAFRESHAESGRRHLVLLVSLVLIVVVQPLLAHRAIRVVDWANVAFFVVYVYVLFVVFGARRERWTAYALFLPVVVGNFLLHALHADPAGPSAAAFHCAVIAFLAYTVATIIRDLLTRRAVSSDHVLGGVCGYLLSGLAWAHVFALAYMLAPSDFGIADPIAPQLQDIHLRSALFNYFSFTTLTSIGFADITPVGPAVYSLMWLEVIFGQFYMAVVVAQLVGLKLVQLDRPDPPDA